MRFLKWFLLILIGACATKGVQHLVQGSGEPALVLHVEGLRNANGLLLVSVFEGAEGFPGESAKALRREEAAPMAPTSRVVFEDLPAGRYAVAVLHDENGDREMATNWMGAPAEGWAVSNDARGRFGPPSFDDAAFEYTGGRAEMTVHLSY